MSPLHLNNKYLRSAPKTVLALVLAFFLIKLVLYHYHMITFPYPNEYREGAMMMTTSGLVKGINPYALEHQPEYTNDYGILYPAIVYPFAKIFGVTLVVHRSVTAVFVVACCVLLFLIMKRIKIPPLLNSCALLIFYASMLFPHTTTACANPSPLGLFLFLLAIFIPWFLAYSWRSLLMSVVLGVLSYYVKPYFLLSIPLMASFLFLFVSKKKALLYGFAALGLSVLSVIGMNHFFNVYFNNCYFIHTNATWLDLPFLQWQLKWYSKIHAPILFLLLVIWGVTYRDWSKTLSTNIKTVWSNIQWRMNKPLLGFSCSLISYCCLCALAILLFSMGQHPGATMWYFFQLLSPFLLMYIMDCAQHVQRWETMVYLTLIINLVVITYEHDYRLLNTKIEEWEKVEELIANHHNILNSPIIAPLLIEHDKPVYDNGLSEYFKMGAYRYSFNKWFSKPDGRILIQYYAFRKEVRDMLVNKEIDLVMLTQNYSPLAPKELEIYYKYIGTVELPLPHNHLRYNISIWRPK